MGIFVAALVLVALGTWGRLNPQGFVWVDRVLDHPVAFGALALLLAAWGLARLTRRRWVHAAVFVTATVVAGAWVLVGSLLAELFGPGEVVATEPAPDAPYAVVVRSDSAGFVDPAWVVSIRQSGGLTAREIEVGCLSGDAPHYTFRAVRWIDAESLEVSMTGHTSIVRVDPASGEPGPVRGAPWTC